MKENIVYFLKKNFFPLVIVLITIYLSLVNYFPGTWFTGWDTLHPEFNFPLNFKRLIFGVWREEQGLGAVAGHSHMADLPRVILLFLASLIFSPHFLRFFYFALCLILGPLGVWFFLKSVVFKEKMDPAKEIASFLGGLFYLLNLGTLQHFYVPFEMFVTQYAFLPWLFLLATKFLTEGGRKNLILFSLVTFLSTPMAYASTLWYVYFAVLIIYIFTLYLIKAGSFFNLRRIISIILATLIVNSFWLLPNIYLLTTSAGNVPQSKINQLFSEKAFEQDKKYATFENTALLRGFLFDWQEFREGEFVYLFDEWQRHLKNPVVLGIGFVLFGFVILGILISTLRKEKFGLALLPLFLFSFVFLIHGFPLFTSVFSFVRDHFPLFREGFRFPWTKFLTIVMFCYAFYFSQVIFAITEWMRSNRKVTFILYLLFFTFLIIWMYPAFLGNLVSSSRRVKIPNEYFETFSWFKKQPESQRIGVFPIPTFWGWEYYRWGFEGAGFLWFGLRQPVLARDFDRWSPGNENYYWEISYTLYSQSLELFEKVLEKYQISWILVDGNIINPPSPKALYFDELEQMLSTSGKIDLVQKFGKIKIYQVNLETPPRDFVFLAKNLPNIGPEYNWNNYDVAYSEYGHYISNLIPQYYFPFRSLFTGRDQEDLEFEVEEKEFHYIFRKIIPQDFKDYSLEVLKVEKELVWVDPSDLSRIRFLNPEVYFDGKILEIKVPKVGGYFSAEIEPTSDPFSQSPKNCNQFTQGEVKNEVVEKDGNKFLQLTSLDTNNCSASFWLPNLPHKLSYLITVESQHYQGKSLLFWLENLNARRADIETYLPKSDSSVSYFIQPPMEEDGLGYTLHFDNISIGRQKTINDLGKITVNPIPFNFLINLRLASPQTKEGSQKQVINIPEKVSHPNPSFYRIEGDFAPNRFLVLSQSFHPGWQAFRVDGFSIKQIKSHVLVNNWANGWILDEGESGRIVLFFLPQLFEYFGFLLLLILFALLIIF